MENGPTYLSNYLAPLKRTWILRCSTCTGHRRLDAGLIVPIVNKAPMVYCCGNMMAPKALEAHTVADVKCSALCTGAKGHTCDCSCGGKNHGTGA